jgi:hypothetical protein
MKQVQGMVQKGDNGGLFFFFCHPELDSGSRFSNLDFRATALWAVLFAGLDLVISLQFTLGDNRSKTLGSHGFWTSIDTEGNMTILS